MKSQTQKPKLLFIVGPTAAGKSDFAVELAEKLQDREGRPYEIINGDSVQFFTGVDIGAAKPSVELISRIPHHLVGHLPLGATYTAGDFRRDALKIILGSGEEKQTQFIVVGGSGFYLLALEKGMYDVPKASEEIKIQLEDDLRHLGLPALYNELKKRDPEAIHKIMPADQYRILRSLEVLRSAPPGATLTKIREEFERKRPPSPFVVNKIGLKCERSVLRLRVEKRTKEMLTRGLIDEVKELRFQGLADWGPLSSVGYREVQNMLNGELSESELESAIVTSTMQLAKRQMTWFKKDKLIHWCDSGNGIAEPLSEALTLPWWENKLP